MTSFMAQSIGGPVIGSMVGTDKGDFSNRTKCAGPRRLVKIAQTFDKVAKKILPKNVNLKNISKKSKIAMVIGLPLLAISSYISGRHLYKMGQIDQKYTDQAKLKEHQQDVLA